MLHGGFAFFNPAHIGHARSPMEQSGEFIQSIRRADGIDLDAAVILIAHPAAQTEALGVLPHEPAEPNPLHAPRNKPLARFDRRVFQPCSAAMATASNSA